MSDKYFKPRMIIDLNKDHDGYCMITRAASILHVHSLREQAREIHQRATVRGYEEHLCLRLLKEYMDI